MPSALVREGIRHFPGVTLDPDPITAQAAAALLGRQPVTIRQWARRYQARQLGTVDRAVYYDYADLAAIDGCMHRGEEVPATPEERDRLRERRRAGYQRAA
jgi:hypothetical protein